MRMANMRMAFGAVIALLAVLLAGTAQAIDPIPKESGFSGNFGVGAGGCEHEIH
jgi:hypothetical protein